MSELFIKVYLDEDVDVLVAKLLRSRGFECMTTQEANQLGSADASQLAFASSHSFALLTHNRVDFEKLATQYYQEGRSHAGIIIAVKRPAAEIARRLFLLLNHVSADEMADNIRYI